MELTVSDIRSAHLQRKNESKLHQRSSYNQARYSLQQQLLHYQHYLESDTMAYFICGWLWRCQHETSNCTITLFIGINNAMITVT